MTVLGVAIGGGLGALVRYHVGGWVSLRQRTPFPAATLIVNASGSLLLGLVVGLVAAGLIAENWLIWGGVGFLGGLTTFSTFTYETLQLADRRAWRAAWTNVAFSGPLSFGAAAIGYLIVSPG